MSGEAAVGKRDFSIDLLRGVAIICIVMGHWIVTGIQFTHGVLSVSSPLDRTPQLVWLSYLLQALAPFFFAAGYASASSSKTPRGRALVAKLAGLVMSIAKPLMVIAIFWVFFGLTLFILGSPLTNVIPVGKLLISPLWFFGVYLVLNALYPVIAHLMDRLGLGLVAIALAVVVISDVNEYAGLGIPGLFLLCTVIAWSIPYQLGIRLRRDEKNETSSLRGWIVLLVGVCILAGALLLGPYPHAMVGVTGAPHSNLGPPSLASVGLGLTQVGLFLVVRRALQALAGRCTWPVVRLLNNWAVPIYLLHQTALLVPIMLASASVPLPGLISNRFGPSWVILRFTYFPLFALVLALLAWGLFGGQKRPKRPKQARRSELAGAAGQTPAESR